MSLNLGLGFSEVNLKMDNPSAREIYEFDDFRLDAGHLMLYRREDELPLAPKAVETLLALVERRGEIVSKDELIGAVWPDVVVEESNLFAYLSVLRKTLGEQKDGKPWVETLRRRGYRFNGDVRIARPANGSNGIAAVDRPPLHLVPSTDDPRDLDAPRNRTRSVGRNVVLAAGLGVVVVAALAFTYWYFISRRQIESVVVMPFANESGDPDLEYLSSAMTETLTGNLSRVPGLQIKSSTSASRYKGNNTDPRTIGKELDVQAVLYGHMNQRGSDVTLRLELVDALTENILWDGTYTRKMSNLMALEGEVSRDIVDRLKAKLLASSEQEFARNHPKNEEAYQQFLLGRSFYRKLTRTSIEKGISYFDKAIELDPTYALAYAAKAEAYRALALAAEMPPAETLPKAREAAQKALEIDPNLSEGHTGLATVALHSDWNFAEAEREFLRALELDPNSSMGHFAYGDFLGRMGRKDESFAHIRRARELDPLSPFLNAFEGIATPDLNEGMGRVNIAIDLEPDFYFAYLIAGGIYRKGQMYPEAIGAYRLAKQLAPNQTWSDVGLADALVKNGNTDEARVILQEMLRRSESDFVPAYSIAAVYRALGENEQALAWLKKGYAQRDPRMTLLREPRWNDIRDDPEFQDLLHRVGF